MICNLINTLHTRTHRENNLEIIDASLGGLRLIYYITGADCAVLCPVLCSTYALAERLEYVTQGFVETATVTGLSTRYLVHLY